jgi:hypothetical protein
MTHQKEFKRRHKVNTSEPLNISMISKLGGISTSDGKEIYNRGRGAWKTNIQSVRMKGTYEKNVNAPRSDKLNAEQWGYARLYAFVNKLDKIKLGKRKSINQDFDIAKKYVKDVKFRK